MNTQRSRTRADLLILFLLPAPVTGIVLILLAFYAIASGFSVTSSETTRSAVAEPTRTLSSQAAILATVNAAPPRQYTPPDVASGGAADVALALGYDEATVVGGQTDYLAVCSACHGIDANGILGLGKTLIASEFVNSRTDEELLSFVLVGRPPWDPENTTGVEMPARGGNPGLTDEDILGIIAYIRVLNGEAPAQTSVAASDSATTSEQEPGGAAPESAGRSGETLYANYCGAEGVTVCDFIADNIGTMEPQVLFDALVNGMSAFDRSNTTGVNILPRVGYPELSDVEIVNLMQFVADAEAVEFAADAIAISDAGGGAATSEGPASTARDGASLYTTFCEGETAAVCEFITQNITLMQPQVLFDAVVNGVSAFDRSNTTGVNLAPRLGDPSITDVEIVNLMRYIAESEGVEFSADAITIAEAGGAAAPSPSEGFVVPDVSALLASLGVTLPDAESRPDRDGETVYNAVCGARYGEGVVAEIPDLCDFLHENIADMDQEDLMNLLVNGSPVWAASNPGVNILPRVAYPPLTDVEIQNLLDYIAAEAE